MNEYKSEVRDGMCIDWDVPIEMEDGVVLRYDIYRPIGTGERLSISRWQFFWD
jgi:predicted acyl esterase